MKLTKENVYIDLRGKSKDELTDLWRFLYNAGEKIYRDNLSDFIRNSNDWRYFEFYGISWCFSNSNYGKNTEVTIEQLKEILKPMGTFREVAMRCTQEQFEAIKPKLTNLLRNVTTFTENTYLINNLSGEKGIVSNIDGRYKRDHNREVHEEWNEEIFLEACGIEVETLQEREQRLIKELKEVQQQIEDSKIKIGDWCKFWDGNKDEFIISRLQKNIFGTYIASTNKHFLNCEKITDSALLESLNRLFK